MTYSNRFIQSDIEEAERTHAWLQTKQPQPVKWIADGIPTAWYAISELAPQNGITAGHREARQGKTRAWHALVVARKGHGKYARAQIGAASSKDKAIALCFAYRNAIRQLLPQAANEVGWRDTKDNAERKLRN